MSRHPVAKHRGIEDVIHGRPIDPVCEPRKTELGKTIRHLQEQFSRCCEGKLGDMDTAAFRIGGRDDPELHSPLARRRDLEIVEIKPIAVSDQTGGSLEILLIPENVRD